MLFWASSQCFQAVAAIVLLTATATATATATKPLRETRLLCRVVYQPGGNVWVREVVLADSRQTLQAVRVDGVPVYSFTRQGPLIRTALDNERIEIDLAQPSWSSDFRGLATGLGNCAVQP